MIIYNLRYKDGRNKNNLQKKKKKKKQNKTKLDQKDERLESTAVQTYQYRLQGREWDDDKIDKDSGGYSKVPKLVTAVHLSSLIGQAKIHF